MAVTIYDVAREAGVSAMTVSMALRGDKRVRDSTRQRIVEVARRLGYTPNAVARALVSGKTRTIGVYCQRVYGALAARFVSGFAAAAAEANYSSALFDAPPRVANLADALAKFRSAKVEGVAIVATRISPETVQQAVRPSDLVVLLNRSADGLPADAVWIDDYQAGYQATAHLIRLGHQRIGYLGGATDDNSMVRHLQGREAALRDAKLAAPQELTAFSPGDWFDVAPKSVEQLLSLKPPPTALVCPHDRLALLAAVTAHRMGLQVPQDLAIVGHYDLPDARLAPVPLTTFDAKVDQMGHLAFGLLHERLTGRRDEPAEIRIEPRLIIRGSCGAAVRHPLQPPSVS